MIKKGLDDAEFLLMLEHLRACDTHYSLIIQLLVFTGFRTHELWSLCVADVDLEKGRINLWRGAKGGQGRTLNLPLHFVQVLQHAIGDEVFNPDKRLISALGWSGETENVETFKAALRRAWGYHKKTVFGARFKIGLHGLRHTYAMRFFKKYNDIIMLKHVLGHKSLASTQRYVEYLQEEELLERTRNLFDEVG